MPDQRQMIAGVFDRAAETYEAVGVEFFAAIGRALVLDASLQPGERVLDVGCGRGAVLFPAVEQVGPRGFVTGIDLAPAMVERTACEAAERGIGNVAVLVMDAQEPELRSASFDVALASLVIFFLPDPPAGLRAWAEALVPGGRLGFTTFDGDDDRWGWVDEVFDPFKPPGLRRAKGASDDGPFASIGNLERLVTDAGFVEPTTVVREHLTRFADPDRWVAWSWSHGLRAFWEFVPMDLRDGVADRVRENLRLIAEPDGSIVLRQRVRYTFARRP